MTEALVTEDDTRYIAAVDAMLPPFHSPENTTAKHLYPQPDPVEPLDEFRRSALVFLEIHRAEIVGRDGEITMLKTELARVREQFDALKDVQSAAAVTARLDRFLADLHQDDSNQAYQTIHNIWESCLQAVSHVMGKDLSDEILAEWNVMYWLDFEERIPNIGAVPFEPSNSATAKRTRTMLVMALLAKALEGYIFSPTYLLEDDDELRLVLARMNDTDKKSAFRRMLLSISDEGGQRQTVLTARIASAVEETLQPVQSLLSPEMLDELKADLSQVIAQAAIAWQPWQRCESHYEVSTTVTSAGWDWLSIRFPGDDDNDDLVHVESGAFETDEVVMVLFPRVCAIDRTRRPAFTPVFPGVVVQKSQLQASSLAAKHSSAVEPNSIVRPETKFGDTAPLPAGVPTITPNNAQIRAATVPEDVGEQRHPSEGRSSGDGKADEESLSGTDDEGDGDGDGDDEDEDEDDGESGTETDDDGDAGSDTGDSDREQPQTHNDAEGEQDQLQRRKDEEGKEEQSKSETKDESEQGKGWTLGLFGSSG